MQNLLVRIHKAMRIMRIHMDRWLAQVYCKYVFYVNGVKYSTFHCLGYPYVHVSLHAQFILGANVHIVNGPIYTSSRKTCWFDVRDKAALSIGENVGLSDVSVVCHNGITIAKNVLIGAGSQLRDTDNHSLNPMDWQTAADWEHKQSAPIHIEENVFIGAGCIILKGVTIGKYAIVGAGSVVAKDIPAGEIWAGNPARFIRKNAYAQD